MSKLQITLPGRAAALISVERAFAEVGLSDPTDAEKTRMSEAILDVSDQICRYIDQPAGLGLCTALETFSTDLGDFPTGSTNTVLPQLRLFLSLRPVGEVLSISIGGEDADMDGLDLDGSMGLLTLRQAAVGLGFTDNRTVTVEYRAGYVLPTAEPAGGQTADEMAASGPPLPRAIQRAALVAVAQAWLSSGVAARSSGILVEETAGIGRTEYADEASTASGLPSSVEAMLDPFRPAGF